MGCYYRLGYSPEEILPLLNSLTMAQVHAALAYALANPDEMDQALRDEDAAVARLASCDKVA
jgi:uncharacterized protein (DUF433 family)